MLNNMTTDTNASVDLSRHGSNSPQLFFSVTSLHRLYRPGHVSIVHQAVQKRERNIIERLSDDGLNPDSKTVAVFHSDEKSY